MKNGVKWLASTIGKRGYIAEYLRASSPRRSSILGTGNNTHTEGFEACDHAALVPSIDSSIYLDSVLNLVDVYLINAMITLSDIDVLRVGTVRDELENRGVHCFFPGKKIAETFGDKWKAYQALRSIGVKTPRSWKSPNSLISDSDFDQYRRDNYVVKPRYGSASQAVTYCQDLDEIIQACSRLERPIIQERIDGRLINVEICSRSNGIPITGCVWERLISVSGETGLTQTIEHPDAIRLLKNVLSYYPVPGPLDCDLIETNHGLYLLEINTRFGGGYPTSHLAGANFADAMVSDIQGREFPEFAKYRTGVKMMKALVPYVYSERNIRIPSLVDTA